MYMYIFRYICCLKQAMVQIYMYIFIYNPSSHLGFMAHKKHCKDGGDDDGDDGGDDDGNDDGDAEEEGTDKHYGSIFSSELYLIFYFEYVIYI